LRADGAFGDKRVSVPLIAAAAGKIRIASRAQPQQSGRLTHFCASHSSLVVMNEWLRVD
jgi:hypothetical protein